MKRKNDKLYAKICKLIELAYQNKLEASKNKL
jgi:hypothetical protein